MANPLFAAMQQTAEQPTQTFAPLAKGHYILTVKRIELRQGPGVIGINLGVTTPTGRWLWKYYNIAHPSEIAQQIGQQQFHNFCAAFDVDPLTLTDQKALETAFLGEVAEGYVTQKNGENDISSFRPIDDGQLAEDPRAVSDYADYPEANP